MEDLIKAKDETIAKMGMLKDALKNQVKTFKCKYNKKLCKFICYKYEILLKLKTISLSS